MNVQIGGEAALCFGLLFVRVGAVMLAMPQMLGIAIPIQIRLLLGLLLAGALMPGATVVMPAAGGVLVLALLVGRELAIGVALAFATAIVVGAVMMAGDVLGSIMEFTSGGILRNLVVMPNPLADGLGTLAGLIFFVGGFHRGLILGLGRSLSVMPLGRFALPRLTVLLATGGRLFVIALELALPLMVPLFILALAQGVIARLAPQVNALVAAPAAILLAGLLLLGLDSAGLAWGITRAWASVTTQALGWLHG